MLIRKIKNRLALGWRLTRHDLASRRAAGAAGVVRSALVPLLFVLVIVAAFALSARGRTDGPLALPLIIIGPLALWSFFADVVVRSAILLREQGYPTKNAAFPLWVVPLLPLAAASLHQFALFAVAAALATVVGLAQASSAGMFLAAWIASVALTAGLAFAVSAALKAWSTVEPAPPVDDVANLVRSVPVALRKLKREAAELRRQNLVLVMEVEARLQRLEHQAADALPHHVPGGQVSHEH